MNRLPSETILSLFEYLSYPDCISFICVRSEYYRAYMKRYVRKITVYRLGQFDNAEYLEKLLSLIEDPFRQLSCLIMGKIPKLFPFQKIERLDATYEQFNHLVNTVPNFQVKSASICRSDGGLTGSCDSFPVEKSLCLYNASSFSAFKLSHLTSVALQGCSISDISSLGNIHSLTISGCDNIYDISALNNNYKVSMICNAHILDFTQSFQNSVIITIELRDTPGRFDLSYWKKVKHLELLYGQASVVLNAPSPLPLTVRRCSLTGSFIEKIDWRSHVSQLHELKLASTLSIKSFEGVDISGITIVDLFGLASLSSLVGFGGKNQLVRIRNCNRIKDFSPLKTIPTVEIDACDGFTNFEDVSEVKNLSVNHYQGMRLTNWHVLGNRTIQSFICERFPNLPGFEFLSKIRSLRIAGRHIPLLMTFLSNGGIVMNEKITIVDCPRDKPVVFNELTSALSVHYHISIMRSTLECLRKRK